MIGAPNRSVEQISRTSLSPRPSFCAQAAA
jgi:hypothetical protein